MTGRCVLDNVEHTSGDVLCWKNLVVMNKAESTSGDSDSRGERKRLRVLVVTMTAEVKEKC